MMLNLISLEVLEMIYNENIKRYSVLSLLTLISLIIGFLLGLSVITTFFPPNVVYINKTETVIEFQNITKAIQGSLEVSVKDNRDIIVKTSYNDTVKYVNCILDYEKGSREIELNRTTGNEFYGVFKDAMRLNRNFNITCTNDLKINLTSNVLLLGGIQFIKVPIIIY